MFDYQVNEEMDARFNSERPVYTPHEQPPEVHPDFDGDPGEPDWELDLPDDPSDPSLPISPRTQIREKGEESGEGCRSAVSDRGSDSRSEAESQKSAEVTPPISLIGSEHRDGEVEAECRKACERMATRLTATKKLPSPWTVAWNTAAVVRRYFEATTPAYRLEEYAALVINRVYPKGSEEWGSAMDRFDVKWKDERMGQAADPLGYCWQAAANARFRFSLPIRDDRLRFATTAYLLSLIRGDELFQLPRTQLGEIIGVSARAVSDMVMHLEERGLIVGEDKTKHFGASCKTPKAFGYRFVAEVVHFDTIT